MQFSLATTYQFSLATYLSNNKTALVVPLGLATTDPIINLLYVWCNDKSALRFMNTLTVVQFYYMVSSSAVLLYGK